MPRTDDGQVALFLLPEEEQAAAAAADRAADRQQWEAHFARADWIAPWPLNSGEAAGTVLRGWVCPSCAGVEPTAFALAINHGLDPDRPPPRLYQHERLTRCIEML